MNDDDDDCITWGRQEESLRKVSSTCDSPADDNDDEESVTPRRNGVDAPSSSEVKKRDSEIDTMWSRLQQRERQQDQDQDHVTITTAACSNTPLRGNLATGQHQQQTGIIVAPSSAPQENRWGIIKTRRRRTRERPRPLSLSANNNGRTTFSAQGSLSAAAENNNNQSKRRMSADDAFADLLEHLKTPDRDESMPPPQKSRKSLSSLPAQSDIASESPPNASGSAMTTTTTTTTSTSHNASKEETSSPDPFGDFPDIDFDELDRSIASMTQQQQQQQATNLSPTSSDMKQTEPLAQRRPQINKISTPSSAAIQPDTDKSAQPKLSNNAQHPYILQLENNNTQATRTDETFEQLDTNNHNNKNSRHVTVQPDDKDDDDPFGEFPMIDLESIDKQIEQATKATREHPPTAAPAPAASLDASDDDDDDDPFGDFPDVDFEKLDQQIAVAITQSCHNQTVRLSRYRIVQVAIDMATSTKTIHVARWKDEMYAEFEDRVAIHQDRGGTFPQPRQWGVDGVIHLRGEWYYTEAQDGDFVNVYSLFGRTCTQNLPLTLDSNAADDLVLIMHPETLLIPTTISEATSCPRRAVLKNRIGSSGSSQPLLFGTLRHRLFEETLQNLDFSQKAIRERIDSIVREASEDIVGCPGTTSHAAQTELYKVVPQVKSFANEYTSFLQTQKQNLSRLDGGSMNNPIFFRATKVYAIEEAINSPEMGIKGSIDAVFQANVANNTIEKATEALFGVELKTGHNQKNETSHMAQLTLYNLMLQARYGSTQGIHASGTNSASHASMLLYLNAESTRATSVSPTVRDAKMLIGQRNLVAIKQKQSTELRGVEMKFETDSKWPSVKLLQAPPPALPPVENPSVCERCYMNRECTLYSSLEMNRSQDKSNSRPNPALLQQYTGHLSQVELDYFATWDRLIDLEASAMVRPVAMKWLKSSAEMEASTKKTVSSLQIQKIESSRQLLTGKAQMMFVTFERSPNTEKRTPISSLGLGAESHAIISLDDVTTGISKRYRRRAMHLARGIVQQSADNDIVLRVSESDVSRIQRTIEEVGGDSRVEFRLDRDEVATGLSTLRRNVINLLTGDKSVPTAESSMSKRLPKLRKAILQLREPAFDSPNCLNMFSSPKSKGIPKVDGLDMEELCVEFHEMNDDQKGAVRKVMTAHDYSLIQGLPGTGKTTTISFLVRLLVAQGKRVLVTSYTHSAVDNLLLKLIKTGIAEKQDDGSRAVIRIGDTSRCHEGVRHLLASAVANGKEGAFSGCSPTAESLRHCMRRARVVGVTALTIPTSNLMAGEAFDAVIVDEAGQISQPAIIGALMAAESFILVGDHMQLPPLVNSELAEKGGYGVSMLKRLAEAHPKHVSQLTFQYRMAKDICQMSNDIVYGGKLKCADDSVRYRQLEVHAFRDKAIPSVYTRVIDPKKSVVFLDTDQSKNGSTEIVQLESTANRQEGGSLVNKTEATLVERILDSLVSLGVAPGSIGIICPFNAQLRLLESYPLVSTSMQQGLECSTIDRYQGKDKPVIIISFVRSNAKGRVGRILGDFRRLNVAVSRAESKLIMVGSYSTLHAGSQAFRPALERLCATDKVIRVSE